MATSGSTDEQLLELLLTLKRTTPAEAKALLNSQPQIAYALMSTMVNIQAVKPEVVQETLAKYGGLPGASGVAPPTPVLTQPPPSAIPPHLQTQMPPRGGTPTYPPHASQGGYPSQPPLGYPPGPPTGPSRNYGTPPPAPGQVPGFVPPPHVPGPPLAPASHAPPQLPHMPPPSAPGPAPMLPESLASLPEDQKALIMRVIAMSRDEVYQLPPADRENIIKLRSTLGLPT